MNKAEVAEIKKLYGIDNSIKKMACCYVDADHHIKSTNTKTFLSLPEEEIHKYLEIFKKGMSGSIGKTVQTMEFSSLSERPGGMQELLLNLRDSSLRDEKLLQDFFGRVVEAYYRVENYMILLIHNTYDVPMKGVDGNKNVEASDEVFDYVACYICPVKLETPGLALNEETGEFEHKDRRWCIDAPSCSFLFPSFEDRSADIHQTTVFIKKPDEESQCIITEMLQLKASIAPEMQKTGFQAIVEEMTEDNNDKLAVVRDIHERIQEHIEESESSGAIVIDKNKLKEIFRDSGIDENALSKYDDTFCAALGTSTESLVATNIVDPKKMEIKTPDIVIKVNAEKSECVEEKKVDGKRCLVIDLSSLGSVEVNGVVC